MIEEITRQNMKDINKPTQPFEIIGKIVPAFVGGIWSFLEYLYENPYEKVYPDDEENWEDYIGNPDQTVFFYYADGECVGQIRLRKNWNGYAYVEDLAVAKKYRGNGVGTKLIQKAVEWAKWKDLPGITLETQDANLLACRFYSKAGFQIGGVDTMLYDNLNEANENAVFWYMKF